MKFELVEPSDEGTATVPLPPENSGSPGRTIPAPPLPGRPLRTRMAHAIHDVRSSLDLLRAQVAELSAAEAATDAPSGTSASEDAPEAVFRADRFTPSDRKDRR
ncbi:cell envelope biogenesis protein TolA [Nocardiopsis sp. CC223A]|uniref:cell envelope biogenesis protein TolA n=1 Tax=Nocardiopsis sp. CC223A TaxID=3044051 RepID=UPI00278C0442|nr:cell envelope biogenesis protein TolA [Nocardiopsis sp. CC223A]